MATKKKKAAKKKVSKKKVGKKKKTSAKKAKKTKVSPIPEGYTTVTGSLKQYGAAETLEFLKAAFGAKVKAVMEGPGGMIMHAQVKIGDAFIHIGEAQPGQAVASSLMLYVKDADKVFAAAVAAGAKVIMPIENMFWGDRYACVQDPKGNYWEIASRIEIVTNAQMKKRSKAFMEQMAGNPS